MFVVLCTANIKTVIVFIYQVIEKANTVMQDALASVNWLQELLSLMGYVTSVNINQQETSSEQLASNSKNYWLEINADSLMPNQIDRLIGQDARVIDSIQYLANIVLNNHKSNEFKNDLLKSGDNNQQDHDFYTLELDGYRLKRTSELQLLTDNAVKQVRETQTEFVIKQLSAADRRHIHQLLESFPDIETHSQGREPNRHLIVKLV